MAKNTLFGRVAGDTIYNLAKIGESEVDSQTERPLYTVKITSIEVLVNPFDDMKKRSRVAPQIQSSSAPEKEKKKKRKGGKQLLSFGDDQGGDEVPVFKKKKYDTRIIAEEEGEEENPVPKKKASQSKSKHPPTQQEPPKNKEEAREDKGVEIETTVRPAPRREDNDDSSPEPEAPKKTALEMANEEIAAIKASMRRNIHTEAPKPEKSESALEHMIPETSMRARKRRPGGTNINAADDQAALSTLKAFQLKLDKAPLDRDAELTLPENDESAGGKDDGEEAELCDLHFVPNCLSCTAWDKQEQNESDDEGWMSHALSFAADRLGKDLKNRRKAEEELVVIDPREKVRSMKEEKKAERDARQGKSGRAWDQARDQARNAQMAKAASLAGRGAK